jgi:hypothetical protein
MDGNGAARCLKEWALDILQVTSSRRFKLNVKGKQIILAISASQDEKEGTELKLPEPEVKYWAGLAARDTRLASCKFELNRSEELGYIEASEESKKDDTDRFAHTNFIFVCIYYHVQKSNKRYYSFFYKVTSDISIRNRI